jgi:hypothetical protein
MPGLSADELGKRQIADKHQAVIDHWFVAGKMFGLGLAMGVIAKVRPREGEHPITTHVLDQLSAELMKEAQSTAHAPDCHTA